MVDHTEDIWDGDANTRYGGGQDCGKKGRRDVGSPEKDKTPECGPDQTPVSDLTAGVDGYRYQGGQGPERSDRGLRLGANGGSYARWNVKVRVKTEERLTTEER